MQTPKRVLVLACLLILATSPALAEEDRQTQIEGAALAEAHQFLKCAAFASYIAACLMRTGPGSANSDAKDAARYREIGTALFNLIGMPRANAESAYTSALERRQQLEAPYTRCDSWNATTNEAIDRFREACTAMDGLLEGYTRSVPSWKMMCRRLGPNC